MPARLDRSPRSKASAPEKAAARVSTSLKLPEANEFSPGQINLVTVLRIAKKNQGDRDAIVESLRSEFFSAAAQKQTDEQKRLKQQRTRAYNVLIGLKGYGLFDFDTNSLTTTGEVLRRARSNAGRIEAFAAHILKNCHGLKVLQAVRNIESQAEKVTKDSLAKELSETFGFKLPRATVHHTKLLQWLREADVLDADNRIDEEKVRRLVGVRVEDLEEWSGLTRPQKALLRTLRELADVHGTDFVTAQYAVDLSEEQHGRVFKSDQLRAQVFRPLEEGGWITLGNVGSGRGGKSGRIAATQKLIDFDPSLLVHEIQALPPDLIRLINRPLGAIFEDLESKDTHIKGVALELLAVRIARALGLVPVWLRERGDETHGAEVDLVAEGIHLKFSRWLFQCKNTPGTSVALSALAKEVGMAILLHAHVIVMVTTSEFRGSVTELARGVTQATPLQVVLVNKKVLGDFRMRGPEALLDFFRDVATGTMRLKKVQLDRAEAD